MIGSGAGTSDRSHWYVFAVDSSAIGSSAWHCSGEVTPRITPSRGAAPNPELASLRRPVCPCAIGCQEPVVHHGRNHHARAGQCGEREAAIGSRRDRLEKADVVDGTQVRILERGKVFDEGRDGLAGRSVRDFSLHRNPAHEFEVEPGGPDARCVRIVPGTWVDKSCRRRASYRARPDGPRAGRPDGNARARQS